MQTRNDTVINYNAGPQKSSLKKPIIITCAIIVLMLIIGATIIMIKPSSSPATDQGESVDVTANFTKLQKLYLQLCGKEVVIDFLAEDYFKDDKELQIKTNITATSRTGRILLSDSKEYIEFNIINEEDDSPDTAVDFVYHEIINDRDTFVMQSSDDTYQHFNGGVTNEFDKLEDAMRDHELFR